MGKRMLSLCMALALCLGLLPATALAADTGIDDWEEIVLPKEPELTDTWLGKDDQRNPYYDISWYDASKTEFELDSAAELAGLAALLLQSSNWNNVTAGMSKPEMLPDASRLNDSTITWEQTSTSPLTAGSPLKRFPAPLMAMGRRSLV